MLKAELLEDARRLVTAGADTELVLAFLRENRCDKIDSINALRSLYNETVPKAKQIVDCSEVWADRFYNDSALHERARAIIRELASCADDELPKITFDEPETR